MKRVCAALALGAAFLAGRTSMAHATEPGRGPKVDAPGKLPEPPPSLPDLAYDSRILSSAAAAEHFQGALDGGWTLARADGGALYVFQLVDKADALEGAWRDPRRPGQPDASGLIEAVRRTPAELVIRFTASPTGAAVVSLRPEPGGFRGVLEEGEARTPVVLRRAPTPP